jgi:pimeloyl-ACP methyl ester carboxylesterase
MGFSMRGFVAQEITLQASDLVRRLVLVGTGPRSGEGMATLAPEGRKSSAPPMTSLITFVCVSTSGE